MAARNRLPPWHEHIRLSNGREVIIRPIRPADADPLRQGFELLEPDEIRQRFLHAVTELTPDMADRLTRPDAKREFALVAAEPLPPGEALVGAVARASISDSGRDAEFAILVSHYIAGLGLGRHLMRRLVRWAKGRKLERLHGDVQEHNTAMLALAQSLGFRREPTEEPGLVRVVLDLGPGRGTHLHDHDEPKAA
ncbi:MAG TPA: GNAT family N-acetyltransferase [Lysobacter sp.]|jgi:RimJ/RimL family protein N-acetyltransferase|nr:GNAT family N-acetyltransferase [Lysobacter sp.]